MDEVLRRRLWRHIEALPDEQVFQVLDYIEFLASKYARTPVRGAGSPVQRFSERLQDRMRAQGVGLRAMKGTFEAVGTADRMLSGIAEAGRTLLREVEQGIAPPEPPAEMTRPRPLIASQPPPPPITRQEPPEPEV